MKTITPRELSTSLETTRIVDVREAREYSDDLGHIAGSLLIPLGELAHASERWDRKRPLVLVCRSGSRSAIGCVLLEKMGFESVTSVAGGMLAWNRDKLPVDR